jgi:hypothetical protein
MRHSAQRAEISGKICMFQLGRCQATGTWLISAQTNNKKLLIANQRFRFLCGRCGGYIMSLESARLTVLARSSSKCKRHTRPLVRQNASYQRTSNCQTIINIWSHAPDVCFIPGQTGRLTVGRNMRLRLRLSATSSVFGTIQFEDRS